MNEKSLTYIEKVEKALNSICTELQGKRLCVCLSGGADSVALLAAANMLKEKYSFLLFAAHVNHLLRGDESFRDQRFCAELCEKISIKLFISRIDVLRLSEVEKKSVEEAARDARYAFFRQLGAENGIDYFLTAHTKNDNAETVIMNIIRGTTISGLCGIPRKNGNVIRPLLELSREENLAFLNEQCLSYITDSSNEDNNYTRNYIRNVLLPAARKINPRVTEALDRLSAYARSDEDYFFNELNDTGVRIRDKDLPPALLRRRHMREYSKVSGGKSLMTVHLDGLRRLLNTGNGRQLSLPGGITAVTRSGRVIFAQSKSLENLKNTKDEGIYDLSFGENSFAGGRVKVCLNRAGKANNENIYNNYTYIKLSFGKICGSVKYRARKPGDRIFNLGVSKSIKKEFIQRGIPAYIRDIIPVFYDDIGIIYAPFIGAADRVYAAEETDDAVFISVRFNERQDLINEEE